MEGGRGRGREERRESTSPSSSSSSNDCHIHPSSFLPLLSISSFLLFLLFPIFSSLVFYLDERNKNPFSFIYFSFFVTKFLQEMQIPFRILFSILLFLLPSQLILVQEKFLSRPLNSIQTQSEKISQRGESLNDEERESKEKEREEESKRQIKKQT